MRDYTRDPLRVAMLGMIPGNCHAYSWSAIINGYDRGQMAHCPAPVIADYLNRQPEGSVQIPFARVTHVWTDQPEEAAHLAAAALIPNIVQRPQDVIGEVDAVIIATDDGDDHVRRARPFVDVGVPLFIDKPLATNLPDLTTFCRWVEGGAQVVSSSGLRYAPELEELRGIEWRWLTGVTCRSWLRYGIHVLEPIYTLIGPGFTAARSRVRGGTEVLELEHASGVFVTLAAIEDGLGSAFVLHGYGDHEHRSVALRDNYTAFRAQLLAFLSYACGMAAVPHAFEETIELMRVLVAGRISRAEGGRRVTLAELKAASH